MGRIEKDGAGGEEEEVEAKMDASSSAVLVVITRSMPGAAMIGGDKW